MSKQAFKRVRRAIGEQVNRDPLAAYAWPGGYPVFYLFADGGVCCAACANDNIEDIDAAIRGELGRHNSHGGWALAAGDVNWEDDDMRCDHCHKPIPSAYGDPAKAE